MKLKRMLVPSFPRTVRYDVMTAQRNTTAGRRTAARPVVVSTTVAKKASARVPKTAQKAVAATVRTKAAGVLNAAALTTTVVKKPRQEKASKKPKKPSSYLALAIRNLPSTFQEPELVKFFSQFGPKIDRLYVVRCRRTWRSRGIAYVKFADTATEEERQTLLEETHAVLLGGVMLTAKWVRLRKAMPSGGAIKRRQKFDYANRTRGVRMVLKRAKNLSSALRMGRSSSLPDVKAALQRLSKLAGTEAKCNAALNKRGIPYSFDGFSSQLPIMRQRFDASIQTPSGTAAKKK